VISEEGGDCFSGARDKRALAVFVDHRRSEWGFLEEPKMGKRGEPVLPSGAII